jgi:hypothetical protein
MNCDMFVPFVDGGHESERAASQPVQLRQLAVRRREAVRKDEIHFLQQTREPNPLDEMS